ncbi:hypothetical protein KR222_009927 [Zaprionus bogoriensis]|nr:hypothetical protein KR222_009927 [Zaprionus bogoriensis]
MSFQRVKLLCLACCLAFMFYHVDSLRLCGSELPEMLDKICVNGFNGKLKRSAMVLPDYNDNDDGALGNYGAYSEQELDRQPLLRAMLGESANHLLKTRRRRLGIADECCSKSCSLKELAYYCA